MYKDLWFMLALLYALIALLCIITLLTIIPNIQPGDMVITVAWVVGALFCTFMFNRSNK